MTDFAFCPRCASPLVERLAGARPRRACPKEGCGFVHWGNPTPVVAAIVEHEGAVLLARGRGWPEKMFGLITGFLEAGEAPAAGALREVKEELGLDGAVEALVGVYAFELRNEVIIAYHVRATGTVRLGDELEACKRIDPATLRPWPFGTGEAVRDWLACRAATRPSGS